MTTNTKEIQIESQSLFSRVEHVLIGFEHILVYKYNWDWAQGL